MIDPVANDFYCREVLSGHTPVRRVVETADVLAYHHTRPAYRVHIAVIPKRHVASLLAPEAGDDAVLRGLFAVIRQVAAEIVAQEGACRVITNLGAYQESQHLHGHLCASERLPG